MEIHINKQQGATIDLHKVNEQGITIAEARTMQVEMPKAEMSIATKPKADVAMQFIQKIALAAGIIRLSQQEYSDLYTSNKILADRFYFVMDADGIQRIYAGRFLLGERGPDGEVKPTNHFPLKFPVVF